MFLEDPRDKKHRFKFARGQAVYFLRNNKIVEGIVVFGRLGNRVQPVYWIGLTGTSKQFSKKESELFETIRECCDALSIKALAELGVNNGTAE